MRTLRSFDKKWLIVVLSIVISLGLVVAIIFVLRINKPDKDTTEADPLDVTVENIGSDDDDTGEEELVIETASAETKVESTSDTTVLALKENAKQGYLNRCVFLGDSRTVAMVNYGLINDDAALAQIGISHPSFKNNTFVNNAGKQYTLKSYLASHQAPVIYIALGVNGINDPSEDHYKTEYIELIDYIMSQAPNSNIVLMSIGPVDDNGAYRNTVQNSQIVKYNDFLRETAKDKHIFYLDISEVLTDPNGQVKAEFNGGDGLHYSSSGCKAIFDYIVSHPVPGISDDGDYVVKYIKPNPNNTKVTMDEGSGIDEEKLKEIMNMMVETTTPTPTATPTEAVPEPTPDYEQEEQARKEEEEREREEEEEEEEKRKEEERKAAEEEERRKAEEAAAEEKQKEEEAAAEEPQKEPEQETNNEENSESGDSGNTEEPTPEEPTPEPTPEPEESSGDTE